ncbi:MAG: hypothetical protein M3P98_00595 [bacterium]|nr:hypothetical protein [bacterium]
MQDQNQTTPINDDDETQVPGAEAVAPPEVTPVQEELGETAVEGEGEVVKEAADASKEIVDGEG